eukprot:2592833-Karenia_brevis.AAC.1
MASRKLQGGYSGEAGWQGCYVNFQNNVEFTLSKHGFQEPRIAPRWIQIYPRWPPGGSKKTHEFIACL